LYLLSQHLTDDNADALLAEARGKTRREIEAILARWFPRPDVLPSITPLPEPQPAAALPITLPGTGTSSGPVTSTRTQTRLQLEPLSASSYRVEFTASAELRGKIEQARNLLSHAIPSGDLAALFERALDELLRVETRRRMGAGRPRKARALKPGSRHVPVDVARSVRERDGHQCTFVDEQGRRCSEKRFISIEHRDPFALGGPPTVENLCLLCVSHNAAAARGSLVKRT